MGHTSPRPLPAFVLQSSLVVLCGVVFAACGGDAETSSTPVGKHIPGGTPQRFAGVGFDLPRGWRSEQREGGMLLVPEGANPDGVIEELYLLGGDANLRSLDGAATEQSIQETVDQLQPDARRTSGPENAKFGALDGRRWTWSGRSADGREVEVRVAAFVGEHGCALFSVGYPERLRQRAADVEAMLGSMSKASAGGAGADRGTSAGGVAAELVGQWIWLSNFTANQGGSQTNTWITLQQDGRYQHHYDTVSTNPEGAAWGSQDESGSWSATGDAITFRPDGGEAYSRRLEKRNHPQNTSDPMIVLDGKAYVTATARRPW